MSIKCKTTFGWKRKAGEIVAKTHTLNADEESDEDHENEDMVDWVALLPKKPALSLEDPLAKSVRLKNEGIVMAEEERFWEAITKWNEAVELNPKDEKLLEMKTQALMAVGEVEPAVETAKATVSLAPTWWVAHQTLGRTLANSGDIRMALKSFSRAVHINPLDTELWEEDLHWVRGLVIRLDAGDTAPLVKHEDGSGQDDDDDEDESDTRD